MAIQKELPIGETFQQLTILEDLGTDSKYKRWCKVSCSCGVITDIRYGEIKSGKTQSCGCLLKAYQSSGTINLKHAGTGTPLYKKWASMRERCNNKNTAGYAKYGARGVTVCVEWDDFSVFRTWAHSNGYAKHMTIDRTNVLQNYSPDNCRFIPMSKQGINKRIMLKNTSGFVGVSWHKTKKAWVARVTVDGTRREVGCFNNALDAHTARGEYFLQNNLKEHYAAYCIQHETLDNPGT